MAMCVSERQHPLGRATRKPSTTSSTRRAILEANLRDSEAGAALRVKTIERLEEQEKGRQVSQQQQGIVVERHNRTCTRQQYNGVTLVCSCL